jgi:tetratricopeptide (TPR) repeat protein
MNMITARVSTVAMVCVLASAAAGAAQDQPQSVKQLLESGRYQEAVERTAAEPGSAPEDTYLAAQAYQKMNNADGARQALAQLAERGDEDPWSLIARSERARLDQNLDEALSLAQAAVAQSAPPPASAYALYQLGLVQSQRQDMAGAAESFEKATAIDPAFAYAHYYAGMANSSLNRIDRVAQHFETFLKLAPEAPERAAVESIMRTVRGR